jgi:hypothetical protein
MNNWNVFKAPFTLEEEVLNPEWEPELNQEYLVQYKFKGEEDSTFLIGRFSKVWFGYNFNWFWGASSLQLSTQSHSKDIENFLGVWKLVRIPEPPRPTRINFVTQEDMEL